MSKKQKPILGAHMSIAKGFAAAAERTKSELDCNAMQIFIKSPRSNRRKPLDPEDVKAFRTKCQEYKIEYIAAHASYLLNFAKPVDKQDPWQLNNIKDDLEKLGMLGGNGLVYHVGKYLKQELAIAKEHLYENLNAILKFAKQHKVKLLLENCAGQGTEIGFQLEEVAEILRELDHPSLGVCIDSCHAYAAGYDLSTKDQVADFFQELDKTVKLKNVDCFHFNNSKMPLASRRDRHANIKTGEIPEAGLKAFAYQAAALNKPIILETPMINDSHKKDIDIVKSWF